MSEPVSPRDLRDIYFEHYGQGETAQLDVLHNKLVNALHRWITEQEIVRLAKRLAEVNRDVKIWEDLGGGWWMKIGGKG